MYGEDLFLVQTLKQSFSKYLPCRDVNMKMNVRRETNRYKMRGLCIYKKKAVNIYFFLINPGACGWYWYLSDSTFQKW
jgi:hypothetical protein